MSFDDDEIDLDGVPRAALVTGVGFCDDGEEIDLGPVALHVRHEGRSSNVDVSRDIVSRQKRVGGWQYSLVRLLQAFLFTRYLRCTGDFLRSIVFAVSFALGPKAPMG